VDLAARMPTGQAAGGAIRYPVFGLPRCGLLVLQTKGAIVMCTFPDLDPDGPFIVIEGDPAAGFLFFGPFGIYVPLNAGPKNGRTRGPYPYAGQSRRAALYEAFGSFASALLPRTIG
jgi:hypothetical protein